MLKTIYYLFIIQYGLLLNLELVQLQNDYHIYNSDYTDFALSWIVIFNSIRKMASGHRVTILPFESCL